MSTATSPAPSTTPAKNRLRTPALARETWAALAIGIIWLVVLADALFGPDIIVNNAGGFTRIPSAIVLAFFAWLATRVVAKHGLGQPWKEPD